MGRFCPICGRENVRFVEGLCEECYRKLNPLVKELPKVSQLTFRICVNCGSVLYKGRWTRKFDIIKKHIQEVTKFRGIISKVEIGYIPLEPGEHEVLMTVCGKAHEAMSEEYCEEYRVYINLIPDVCPTCRSVIMGKERALIQIRYVGERHTQDDVLLIRHIVNQVLAKSDEVQRGAVIDIEENEHGIDIKLTNNTIARAIASAIHRTFPSKICESHKLVGVDRSGKQITKLTISIHILNVKKGDVVTIDGKDVYYVLAVSKNTLYVKDLKTMNNLRLNLNDLFKRKVDKINVRKTYGKVVHKDGKVVIECEDGKIITYNRYLPEGVMVRVIYYEDKPIVIEEEILPSVQ